MITPSAHAAAPANDEISKARVITSVPSALTVDSTDATFKPTTDTDDYPCVADHSVWFKSRPTAAITARVTTVDSYIDTVLGVFRGPANNLTPVACNDDTPVALSSAVEVHFNANTTYFIAVSSCCSADAGYGGPLTLRLYVPRVLTTTAPILGARAGDVSGRAFFDGTFRCSNPGGFQISIFVSQRVGARVARGYGAFGSDSCRRAKHEWAMTIDSETGDAFRPGKASLTITRWASDGSNVVETTSTQIITLDLDANARVAVGGGR